MANPPNLTHLAKLSHLATYEGTSQIGDWAPGTTYKPILGLVISLIGDCTPDAGLPPV